MEKRILEGGPCSECGEYVGPGEWHECGKEEVMDIRELKAKITDLSLEKKDLIVRLEISKAKIQEEKMGINEIIKKKRGTKQTYYDSDGNEVTLYKLVRIEPDWAVSIIQYYEKRIAELQKQLDNK